MREWYDYIDLFVKSLRYSCYYVALGQFANLGVTSIQIFEEGASNHVWRHNLSSLPDNFVTLIVSAYWKAKL